MQKKYQEKSLSFVSFADEIHTLAKLLTLCMFGSFDPAKNAASKIKELVSEWTDEKWLRFSEKFRELTSMEWNYDWEKISLIEKRKFFQEAKAHDLYAAVLKIGMQHPNGFFREQCIREAKEFPGMLPFFLLRMNDWVEPVRQAAWEQIQDYISYCSEEELIASFPFLEKVERSERREKNKWNELKNKFESEIIIRLPKVKKERIWNQPFLRRKSLYRFLCRKNEPLVLELKDWDVLLAKEKNGYLRAIILQNIFINYSCPEELLEMYCKDSYSQVRRLALYEKYQRYQASWDGLEQVLLDPCRAIREFAVFLLKKYRNLDVTAYYSKYLDTDLRVTAVLGLGENRGIEYCQTLERFLDSEDSKLVHTTLTALGRLLGEKGEEIYCSFLTDERSSVSKAAYQCLRKNQIMCGTDRLYKILHTAKAEHVKRYALFLLLRERCWKRIPYLLLYCKEAAPDQMELILHGLTNRTMYETVSGEEADRIRNLLEQEKKYLPDSLRQKILFDLKFVSKGFA